MNNMNDNEVKNIARLLIDEQCENIELVKAMDISLSLEQLSSLKEELFKIRLESTISYYLKYEDFGFYIRPLKKGAQYRCRVMFSRKAIVFESWGEGISEERSENRIYYEQDLYERFKVWLKEINNIKFESDFRPLFNIYQSKESINKEIDGVLSKIEKNKLKREKQRLNE